MGDKLALIIEKIDQAETDILPGTIRRGLEKESLRIDAEGVLSQQPHPSALGAALRRVQVHGAEHDHGAHVVRNH